MNSWIGLKNMLDNIPFFSLKNVPRQLKEEWQDSITEVLNLGIYINGPKKIEFETSWAKLLGAKYAVGVGNGFDGLVLALMSLGIGPGDLVAVPAHTFIATWFAIKHVGAEPIGVDVNKEGLLDVDILFTIKNIKAVIPVHMHGKCCDMSRLTNWAKENSIFVIEDASQAHFATSNGKFAGTFGDIGVFSLYPSKNLGALGDAGIVVTDNLFIAKKIRELSNYGSSSNSKYHHLSFGINSRLDELQASVLIVNLKYLEKWNHKRREIANIYLKETQIDPLQSYQNGHVFHHFVVKSSKRNKLITHFQFHNIGTEIHYPNLASDEYLKIFKKLKSNYPIAKKISKSIISLPLHQWLNDLEIERIINITKKAIKQNLIKTLN